MEPSAFNCVKIDVKIDYAQIELYSYEPIEGKSTRLFYCDVIQKDNRVVCDEGESTDKYCAICNDQLWDLMQFSHKIWPLGKWSKQRGYGWHYLSTRDDEKALLDDISDRFYTKRIQSPWKKD